MSPGISVSRIPIPFRKAGINWSSYWATRTPETLVATVASDTQINLTWTDAAEAADGLRIYYSTDNVTFTEHGTADYGDEAYSATGLDDGIRYYFRVVAYKGVNESEAITDDEYTLFAFDITPTGTGAGVATVRMMFSSNQTVTLTGDANFYTDAGGTANESKTWNVTTGADFRTIYLKCTTGSAKMLVPVTPFTRWGWKQFYGWLSGNNAPSVNVVINKLVNLQMLGTGDHVAASGAMPAGLTYFALSGENITYSVNQTLPSNLATLITVGMGITANYYGCPSTLTYIYVSDTNAVWHYEGALPAAMTFLRLKGGSATNGHEWVYEGALPSGLEYLCIYGDATEWTYSGALPVGITYLGIEADGVAWSYDGALPPLLTSLRLEGAKINWTGLDVSGTGNFPTSAQFMLYNYRQAKMSSTDMVTLLTNLTNRVGSLPNLIEISDYADYASPPSEVADAVTALKAAKANITTVTFRE